MSFVTDQSAVFFRRDDAYVPSELARGPWDPNAMHGGPVAALIAREVEQVLAPGLSPTRLTIELLRPVLLVPLTVTAELVRPGKRVNLVEVAVASAEDGIQVARALALGIRRADLGIEGEVNPSSEVPPPPPEAIKPNAELGFSFEYPTFYGSAVEVAVVEGAFLEPGPTTAWFRLAKPVVDGEEPTPFMRACAAADFGNGISTALPFNQFVFINPDLTVYLHRPPVGEWICLEATTWVGDAGAGIAESALYDSSGRLGRSVQSLFIDRR